MYLDTMTFLPDDILTKVDRATMAYSLEGRMPFLDPAVAALAWRLPPDMKVRGATGKWLVRRLLHRYVPPPWSSGPRPASACRSARGCAVPCGPGPRTCSPPPACAAKACSTPTPVAAPVGRAPVGAP